VNAVGLIFARGGSKGLPGKNLLPFEGKPLIGLAILHAKAVSRIRRVIVSTDCNEIAKVAKKYGGEVPFLRPTKLATDRAPEWLAWRHALDWIEKEEGQMPDAMVSVPTTSPLRTPNDIDAALDKFYKSKADAVIAVTPSDRNPWFNMVTINNSGAVKLVKPEKKILSRRQDAPQSYDITTVVYVLKPKFVKTNCSLFSGRLRAIKVPRERAIDIDTALDYKIACFLADIKHDT